MPSRRFVLLHSPLLGPMAWRTVTAELTRRGHAAEAPAWPRLSGVAANFYANLADHLVDEVAASGDPLILVAHSGAGALVPALAARLTTPLAGVIFVDAILPHPGRSWFDIAPAGIRERLRAGAQMGELPSWDEGVAAGRYGWPLVRLSLHHLAMLTNPEPVADALESLAARLTEPAHG